MQNKSTSIELPKTLIPQKSETQAVVLQLSEKPVVVKIDSGVPDWVSPAIQIAVAILAACASVGAILWQMKKQREHTLEQQKQITKSQLRLEAYREFQKIYAPFLETSLIEVEIQLIFSAFQRQLDNTQQGFPATPIQYREPNFREQLEKHLSNAIELTFYIERHAPLLPNFDVFKRAFSVAHYEIQKDRRTLQATMLRWFPMEHANFKINPDVPQFVNNPEITSDAVKEFEIVMQPILDSLGLLKVWAMDLAVELQNHLLGDYAECKVSHREPIDPKFFVVSISRYDALMRYFDEETDQGRNTKLIEDSVRQEQLLKQQVVD
jgi:hypothetical protein